MSKKNQHIVPHSSGGWAVKSPNSKRANKVVRTQKEAIAIGIKIAKKQGSEIFIHGKNGQIRERNTYGTDSFPPKG